MYGILVRSPPHDRPLLFTCKFPAEAQFPYGGFGAVPAAIRPSESRPSFRRAGPGIGNCGHPLSPPYGESLPAADRIAAGAGFRRLVRASSFALFGDAAPGFLCAVCSDGGTCGSQHPAGHRVNRSRFGRPLRSCCAVRPGCRIAAGCADWAVSFLTAGRFAGRRCLFCGQAGG